LGAACDNGYAIFEINFIGHFSFLSLFEFLDLHLGTALRARRQRDAQRNGVELRRICAMEHLAWIPTAQFGDLVIRQGSN